MVPVVPESGSAHTGDFAFAPTVEHVNAAVLALVLAPLLLAGCTAGDEPRRDAAPPSPTLSAPEPALPPTRPSTPSPLTPVPGPVTAQEAPAIADDPGDLAAEITQAERTIRSDAGDAAVARAGVVQQAAYRALAARRSGARRCSTPSRTTCATPSWRTRARASSCCV